MRLEQCECGRKEKEMGVIRAQIRQDLVNNGRGFGLNEMGAVAGLWEEETSGLTSKAPSGHGTENVGREGGGRFGMW